MRICIFGAGAIGGYLAARLAAVGSAELSLIARGAHLEAIKARGLKLIEGGRETTHRLRAVSDATELGPQDYLLLTLKAHSVGAALPLIAPLIGTETTVVTMQNGVPWWYFHAVPGPLENTHIETVDPGGRIWDAIGPEKVLGCAVYPAAELASPGAIRHIEGTRFTLGEPDGGNSERALRLSEILTGAGLQAPVRTDIRRELWVKLWGNLSFNPISALTRATLEDIVANDGTRALARQMMLEAQAIAEALGITFPIDVDRRIAGAGKVGAHRTSMLQDLEAGRAMEIDALIGAVEELGRLTGKPTPSISAVLALVLLLADTMSP